MAFLSILPKAPERYGRLKNADAAIARRNWVLGEMYDNEWITQAQMVEARAQPLGLITQRGTGYKRIGGYFTEEVRRQLIERFGETAENGGPYSVYAGGLWVRTSMNPLYQTLTTQALRDGLLRYNAGKGVEGQYGRDRRVRRQMELAACLDQHQYRLFQLACRGGARQGEGSGLPMAPLEP